MITSTSTTTSISTSISTSSQTHLVVHAEVFGVEGLAQGQLLRMPGCHGHELVIWCGIGGVRHDGRKVVGTTHLVGGVYQTMDSMGN